MLHRIVRRPCVINKMLDLICGFYQQRFAVLCPIIGRFIQYETGYSLMHYVFHKNRGWPNLYPHLGTYILSS